MTRQELKTWINAYNSQKYPEEPYSWALGIAANATRITDKLQKAIRWLFYWKLGKVGIKRTLTCQESLELDGVVYYASGTTESNNDALEKALSAECMLNGMRFRDGESGILEFITIADRITANTLVLPAFYCHIWRPTDFPIIDKYVWASMKAICPQLATKSLPSTWGDYFLYRQFIVDLQQEFGCSLRSIDKALWSWRDGKAATQKPPGNESGQVNLQHPVSPTHVESGDHSREMPSALVEKLNVILNRKEIILPYKRRGITISIELIQACMTVLNDAEEKALPQNNKNSILSETPDGLDARIKARVGSNLRTANIVSDFLETLGIVEIFQAPNWETGRQVKWTRLRQEWGW